MFRKLGFVIELSANTISMSCAYAEYALCIFVYICIRLFCFDLFEGGASNFTFILNSSVGVVVAVYFI